MIRTNSEPNILGAIYAPNGPNCRMADLLRNIYRLGLKKGFDERLCDKVNKIIDRNLILEARVEHYTKMLELTEPFFLIGQALQKQVFEGQRVEHPIIINGAFANSAKKRVKSVIIPGSFGGNPYEVFSSLVYGLVDDVITNYTVNNYLQENRKELLDSGYKYIVIDSSLFFFIPQSEISTTFLDDNGEVNMHKLTPFITNIPYNGTIMTSEPKRPSKTTFLKESPDYLSERLKSSPIKKLMRKFGEEEISEEEIIYDPAGYRRIVKTLAEAYKYQRSLQKGSFIGNDKKYKIIKIESKDHFEKPKDGFETLINNLLISDKTGKIYPIEIQIQIKPYLYQYEINCDLRSANNRERKQKRGERKIGEKLSPHHIALNKCVEEKLKEVYGAPTMIDIKTLKPLPAYNNHYKVTK